MDTHRILAIVILKNMNMDMDDGRAYMNTHGKTTKIYSTRTSGWSHASAIMDSFIYK
jgi:hypothetical protein